MEDKVRPRGPNQTYFMVQHWDKLSSSGEKIANISHIKNKTNLCIVDDIYCMVPNTWSESNEKIEEEIMWNIGELKCWMRWVENDLGEIIGQKMAYCKKWDWVKNIRQTTKWMTKMFARFGKVSKRVQVKRNEESL